jgi:hypothetical protein
MPSYSWLQMIRVLDGQEPGHPDSPDTDGHLPPLLPDALKEALADGLAVVLGVPVNGHRHIPIPAEDWLRIRIDLRSDPPYANPPVPYAIAAILPAAILGEVRDGAGWYDLKVKHPELVKLKAELARVSCHQAPGAHGLEEELTLEEVAAESNSVDSMRYRADGVRKHIGFAQQDAPIVAIVMEIARKHGINAWAALAKIPDEDLPGIGTSDSRRKRIHGRIPKLKTPENS